MIIAVDIDEVLADTVNTFCDIYNKKYKTKIKRQDFYNFKWWEIIGVDKSIFKEQFIHLIRQEHLFEKIPVKAGALAGMSELKQNHALIIVTGRPKALAEITKNWLKRNFKDIFKSINFTREQILEPSIESKFSVCKRLKAQLLIEDEIDNATECASNGLTALLFDAPWNQQVAESDRIIRVHSWSEITNWINNYEQSINQGNISRER